MTANQPKRKGLKCYHCGKLGHIKRNCRILQAAERKSKERKDMKQKANKAEVRQREDSSGSESDALVVGQALSASATNNGIVDSGATCHMCNNDKLFVNIRSMQQPLEIMLGDGHALEATGQGVVALEMKLPAGKTRRCKLHDVLFVPKLSYNLLSVSKAAEAGKMAEFNKAGCQILDANKKLIAAATRVGSLYYLDCQSKTTSERVNAAEVKENVWHRRFGHLGVRNLQKLAKDKLADGLDYDPSKGIGFCESCTEGKHH